MVLAYTTYNLKQTDLEHATVDLTEFQYELESESEEIAASIEEISFESNSDLASKLKKERWYIVKVENGKEVYWNSNKVSFDSAVLIQKKYPIYYTYGDDVYLLFVLH